MSNQSGKITGLAQSPGYEYLGVCGGYERFAVFKSPATENQFLPIQGQAATSFFLDRMPINYSPDGNWFAIALWQYPFVALYEKVNGAWEQKPSNVFSAVPTDSCSAVAFSPSSTTLIVTQQTSPYINIYTYSAGAWTRASNPTSLPTSATRSVAFNPAGTSVAFSSESTPFVHIYNISGSTYTKLSNPASLPASGAGTSVAWNSAGTHLALTTVASPRIHAWTRSGDTFTKVSNPGTLPTGSAYHCKYNHDGSSIAVAHNTSPFVSIYNISGSTYTKIGNPGTLPAGVGYGVAWNNDGTSLAHMGGLGTASRYLTIYNRSGDTFTKLSDPASSPNGQAAGVAWSTSTNNLLVAFCTSPGIIEYSRSSDTFTDQNIFNRTTATNITPAGDKSNNQYNCGAISPDGTLFANGTQNNNPNWAIQLKVSESIFSPFTLTAGVPTSGAVSCIAFNTSSEYVAIASENSPFLNVYSLNKGALTMAALTGSAMAESANGVSWTTFGGSDRILVAGTSNIASYTRTGTTTISNDSITYSGSSPSGVSNGVSATSDGTVIAVAHSTSPYISVYTRSSNTLTKIANPSTLPGSAGQVIAWNPTNTRVAIGLSTNFKVYNWNGSTLTALSDPGTLPGAGIRGIAWNYDGSVLFVQSVATTSTGAPFIFMYSVNGDTLTLMNSWNSRQFPYSYQGTAGPKGYGGLAYYYNKDGV
jgi:WD40 repeat protein